MKRLKHESVIALVEFCLRCKSIESKYIIIINALKIDPSLVDKNPECRCDQMVQILTVHYK